MEDDYIIINDKYSLDYGIIVEELPEIIIPEKRVEESQVLGRDGILTISDNTYKAFVKRCKLYYEGDSYDSLVDFIDTNGEVIFSNTPDRKYFYTNISEIPLNEIIKNEYSSFDIIFKCQPFGYSLENNQIIIIDNNSVILNNFTMISLPIIKIFGNGNINLYINGRQVILKNVEEYIVIDSTKLRTYKDTVRQNDKKIGDWPFLDIGRNEIAWDGNVSKVEILPNWRYLI